MSQRVASDSEELAEFELGCIRIGSRETRCLLTMSARLVLAHTSAIFPADLPELVEQSQLAKLWIATATTSRLQVSVDLGEGFALLADDREGLQGMLRSVVEECPVRFPVCMTKSCGRP
jgi:hypothetical protein